MARWLRLSCFVLFAFPSLLFFFEVPSVSFGGGFIALRCVRLLRFSRFLSFGFVFFVLFYFNKNHKLSLLRFLVPANVSPLSPLRFFSSFSILFEEKGRVKKKNYGFPFFLGGGSSPDAAPTEIQPRCRAHRFPAAASQK